MAAFENPEPPREDEPFVEWLVTALDDWDPMRLRDCNYAHDREYELEARLILNALQKDGPHHLAGKMWQIFKEQFSEEMAGPRDWYVWMAERIWRTVVRPRIETTS